MSRMELEEQNFETEEWGIPQHMQRLLGEIKYFIDEQLLALDYYTQPQNSRQFSSVKQNLELKDDSIKSRLESYKKLHIDYIQAKQIYYYIQLLTKDKRLITNRVSKIYLKDPNSLLIPDNLLQQYEVEEIKDPKFKDENQIIYIRNRMTKWWFVRVIKHIQEKKLQFILDVEVFMCDQSKEMKSSEQKHTFDIMKQVNIWFKQFFFNHLCRRMISSKFKENILTYIEDTMLQIFSSEKCCECQQIFKENEHGQFTQPCVKLNDAKSLCHYSCLFN